MKLKILKLGRAINKLKDRIVQHRTRCWDWNHGKPCFDCHNNTLTKIEKALKEIQ